LTFVRMIGGRQGRGSGQLMHPRGVAMRIVKGRETVLLAEYLNHRYAIHHTPYTIRHTPYTMHHAPYTMHHAPYLRLTCTHPPIPTI
jgi:hypothetical protein